MKKLILHFVKSTLNLRKFIETHYSGLSELIHINSHKISYYSVIITIKSFYLTFTSDNRLHF